MKRTTMAYLIVGAAALFAFTRQASASSGGVPAQGGGYAQISELAGVIEQKAHLRGFRAFALGVAERESNGNNLAVNDSASEARAACNLYNANRDSRYANNPFPAERFCFGSGGYYGFLPATALAGNFFRNSDPYLVFDPSASTAMLADYAYRVSLGFWSRIPPEHRNWLTIRRFMASNTTGLDWDESGESAVRVRENFANELRQRGLDPNVMYQTVSFSSYPGTGVVYGWISGLGEEAGADA